MRKLFVLAGLICASGLACSKKTQNSPGTPAPPAMVAEAAPATGDVGVDLAQINDALKKFHQEKGRLPVNVGELVTAGYLAHAPTPPAGRRFVVDPTNIEVRVEYRLGY